MKENDNSELVGEKCNKGLKNEEGNSKSKKKDSKTTEKEVNSKKEEEANPELVESIFRLRENLIILGLTGRTGAGCSTVADILSRKKFDELDLRSYKTRDFNNADERKYSIVYRFMKDRDKWTGFHVIEASTIIFSFIAESKYEEFYKFLDGIAEKSDVKEKDNLKQSINELKNNITSVFLKNSGGSEQNSKVTPDKIIPDLINLKELLEIEEIKKNVQDALSVKDADKCNGDGTEREGEESSGKHIIKKLKEFIEKNENKTLVNSDTKRMNDAIDQYCGKLKGYKNKFKEELSKYQIKYKKNDKDDKIYEQDLYSYVMQTAGNNLRKTGSYMRDKPLNGENTESENVKDKDKKNKEEQHGYEITVAERINDLIKIINLYEEQKAKDEQKDKQEHKEKRVRICIDALRNTYEIQYFRDKYRAFYAVAVNTEDKDRRNRLAKSLNMKQLSGLDDMEYPEEKTQFYKQNIQGCLEISDIYLYNPNVNNQKYYELTEQLIKYITLMLHPGLVAPTHLERCMQLAFNARCNSGCLSRKVGAVVTGDDFSVRSVGWNDVPKGQVPCNLRCVEDYCENKDSESFSEYELTDDQFGKVLVQINKKLGDNGNRIEKMRGRTFQYCFKDVYTGLTHSKNQVHTRALHAEENAFLQIAKYGGAEIRGGKLFTTASPCELCSKKAYQLGIKEIYYIDPYPGISKSHILSFGKNDNPQMILFQGAIGNAYISLYSPRIAYKDELELQTGISVKKEAEEKVERDPGKTGQH